MYQHQALDAALYETAFLQLTQQVYEPGMHVHDTMKESIQTLQVISVRLHGSFSA